MDDTRFSELERKRDEVGLTDQEANELGRMMAARAGQPYSNADDRGPADDRREVTERPEQGYVAEEGHLPEEERAVGTEHQHVSPAGSGYLPDDEGAERP